MADFSDIINRKKEESSSGSSRSYLEELVETAYQSPSFLDKILSKFEQDPIRRPLLKPTKPPRGRATRNTTPFDFFGTLFTGPSTAELNPMTLLNQTV